MRRRTLLLVLPLLTACSKPPEPLPTLYSVPPFQLTAQDGRAFSSAAELTGRVWVADFIYTTCTGPCPRMSRLMKNIAEATRTLPNVRYISITVDPAHDTPEVLAAYAKRYAADTTRWSFLTGPTEALHTLKREGFKLGNVDGSLNHSTRFVLVDARGAIRGLYGTADDSDIPNLISGIQQLATEPAP